MIVGASVGAATNLALIQHFHLPKALALVGTVPSALLGGFLFFWLCHFLGGGIATILDTIIE